MKRRWYLLGSAGLCAGDQILKSLTEKNQDEKEERKLAGPVVLRRVSNKGMCLGLLSGQPETVRILSLAASAAVTISAGAALLFRKGFLKKAGSCLAAAGAWSNTADRFIRGHVVDYIGFRSNTADRFIRGHVVDYIGFRLKNKKLAALTYNLADFYIAAGAFFMVLDSIRSQFLPHRDPRQK